MMKFIIANEYEGSKGNNNNRNKKQYNRQQRKMAWTFESY